MMLHILSTFSQMNIGHAEYSSIGMLVKMFCRVMSVPLGVTVPDLHGAADSWGAGVGGRGHQH